MAPRGSIVDQIIKEAEAVVGPLHALISSDYKLRDGKIQRTYIAYGASRTISRSAVFSNGSGMWLRRYDDGTPIPWNSGHTYEGSETPASSLAFMLRCHDDFTVLYHASILGTVL